MEFEVLSSHLHNYNLIPLICLHWPLVKFGFICLIMITWECAGHTFLTPVSHSYRLLGRWWVWQPLSKVLTSHSFTSPGLGWCSKPACLWSPSASSSQTFSEDFGRTGVCYRSRPRISGKRGRLVSFTYGWHLYLSFMHSSILLLGLSTPYEGGDSRRVHFLRYS